MVEQVTLHDAWGNLAVTLSCKAIVIESGKIWLRRNERGDWELPGGRLDNEEQPEQTVIREIREELGLKIENPRLIDFYVWQKDFGTASHIGIVTFVAEDSERVGDFEYVGEAGESEFRLFSVNEALSLANLPYAYKRSISKL